MVDPLGAEDDPRNDKPWSNDLTGTVSDLCAYIQSTDWMDPRLVGVGALFETRSWNPNLVANFVMSGPRWMAAQLAPLDALFVELSGNASEVEAHRAVWEASANDVWALARDLYYSSEEETLTWVGEAANAYRDLYKSYLGALDGLGYICDSVRWSFTRAWELLQATCNMTRDLAQGLFAALLQQVPVWNAQIAATDGAALADVAAEATAIIGAWADSIFDYCDALVNSMTALTNLLRE